MKRSTKFIFHLSMKIKGWPKFRLLTRVQKGNQLSSSVLEVNSWTLLFSQLKSKSNSANVSKIINNHTQFARLAALNAKVKLNAQHARRVFTLIQLHRNAWVISTYFKLTLFRMPLRLLRLRVNRYLQDMPTRFEVIERSMPLLSLHPIRLCSLLDHPVLWFRYNLIL